ncbi:putative DNA primase/helicase [Mucilaginibacter gossypiicola]|uniref:Putative DNA primase/helicase n=1 Tax=Mucilaginibacter gossypiicola TaxID=551995 RepID=A0A1H8UZD9_9SPHI|nr:DNA primase family protein [Mucilaginibacter gossypiicola]SEP08536.1 putative DNA primase/helicase [Mucilaginibacter gossypiicola]
MNLINENEGAAIAAPFNEIKELGINNKPENMQAPKEVIGRTDEHVKEIRALKKDSVLAKLLKELQPIDFRSAVNLRDDKANLARKHYVVCTIEQIMETAKANNWGLCNNQGAFFAYNTQYWESINDGDLKVFLGKAAEKLGADPYDSRYFKFQDELFKQFLASANLPNPEPKKGISAINVLNGTFEIGLGSPILRPFDRDDFITYQLPFRYDPNAEASLFNSFINRVLPDEDCQKLLAEYLGYLFIKRSNLNIQKVLLLYGSGSNGKSVVFEVISALLGSHNVTNYSLEKLTDSQGSYRAGLANKLLNYASEISNKVDGTVFKQLASGEPTEARKLYGNPFSLTDYAKFIFNCNQLPVAPEQTHAYFRRFAILPFTVTISEEEADPDLSKKIIDKELSGVFNWVLSGLERVLQQKKFTESVMAMQLLDEYKKKSDNVALFIEEEEYKPEINDFMALQTLYSDYVNYCQECGYRKFAKRNFSDNLRKLGFTIERKSSGMVVFTKDRHAPSPNKIN